jgi:peptide/nickel transport system permease protein
MLLILFLASIISFTIIQLPPGDFLTSYIMQLRMSGTSVSESEIARLEKQYDLDAPMVLQYLSWLARLVRGDMGMSFEWNRPVATLLAERIPITLAVSVSTLIFTYLVAVPIGIYSATHQYSAGDYAVTVLGFAGLAIPNFLFALILMFFASRFLGLSVGGLFSPQYQEAPWSLAKALDMLAHLPIPIVIVGLSGTASLIRIMRGCLLDELRKQYVVTARAKGVVERRLLFRYPVRVAINPIISSMGWTLPAIISGETITAIVLDLPTTGPLLFEALMSQDMFLAGSTVMLLTVLTVVGILLSDVLLVAADPRIRFEKQEGA